MTKEVLIKEIMQYYNSWTDSELRRIVEEIKRKQSKEYVKLKNEKLKK